MPTLTLIHLFALALHLVVYAAAAVYAHITETHRDFCIFYAAAAAAALLTLCVAYVEEGRKSRPREHTIDADRPGTERGRP